MPKRAWRVTDRHLANLAMTAAVAERFEVRTLFVWQPVPNFRAPPDASPFPSEKAAVLHSPAAYPRLDDLRAAGKLPANFLWLADAQLGRTGDLYVDTFHCSARFNDALAEAITQRLAAGGELR